MNGRPWKRYVATMCRAAWGLDARATDEVMRCVEEMMVAEGIPESDEVQVFLSIDAGEIGVGRSTMTVRLRTSAEAEASSAAPPVELQLRPATP